MKLYRVKLTIELPVLSSDPWAALVLARSMVSKFHGWKWNVREIQLSRLSQAWLKAKPISVDGQAEFTVEKWLQEHRDT